MKSQFTPLALGIVLLCASAPAQWVHSNGPYGGHITCLAVSPAGGGSGAFLFAGTNRDGVYLSTNNGTSWKAVNVGLPNTYIHSLAVWDSSVFAGTEAGVFLSTNNGATWIAAGLTKTDIRALLVSRNSRGWPTLFAGGRAGGRNAVFSSTDKGASWSSATIDLTASEVTVLASSTEGPYGRSLFAAAYTDGPGGGVRNYGVFLSTNSGVSWTEPNTRMRNISVRALLVSPVEGGGGGTRLFAGSEGQGGVFVSTNNGTSWTEVGLTGISVYALAGSPDGAGGTNLFAGTSAGVFLSTNNGKSWTGENTGLVSTSVNSLALSSNAQGGMNLYAGTSWGVYRSTNRGTSWMLANDGMMEAPMNVLSVSPDGTNLFAGTTFGGVFLSTNSGASWTQASYGLTDLGINVLAFSPEKNGSGYANLFAGTGSGVFLSTNNGKKWTAVNGGLEIGEVRALALSYDGNGRTYLFAGISGSPGVLLSTNNGSSWTPARIGLTAGPVIALVIIPDGAGGTNLFAGTYEWHDGFTTGGVYLSADNGGHWTAVNTGLPDPTFNVLAFWPTTGGAGTNIYAGSGGRVFLSTNNGASWKAISTGLPPNTTVKAFAFSPVIGSAGAAHIFVGTYSGVFLSTNNGTSWTAVNSGLTDTSVWALAVAGSYLFAGNDHGVWRRPLSEMVTAVDEMQNVVPSDFALSQNYPNPFNPSTTIKYELPRASLVNLSVYNMLGLEVATLVNAEKPAGVHTVQFNGSVLASGVYFYRLETTGFVQTRKLVLVK